MQQDNYVIKFYVNGESNPTTRIYTLRKLIIKNIPEYMFPHNYLCFMSKTVTSICLINQNSTFFRKC